MFSAQPTGTKSRNSREENIVIDREMLDILCCPKNRTKLHLANHELLRKLKECISTGAVKNVGGTPVLTPPEGGLITDDSTMLYPVVNRIPILVANEAIHLAQIK